jgi:hypothetical protein
MTVKSLNGARMHAAIDATPVLDYYAYMSLIEDRDGVSWTACAIGAFVADALAAHPEAATLTGSYAFFRAAVESMSVDVKGAGDWSPNLELLRQYYGDGVTSKLLWDAERTLLRVRRRPEWVQRKAMHDWIAKVTGVPYDPAHPYPTRRVPHAKPAGAALLAPPSMTRPSRWRAVRARVKAIAALLMTIV